MLKMIERALVDSINVYIQHGRLLRAFVEAASGDERVDSVYRAIIQDFIKAAAQHIRAEQQAGNIKKI
jgi:uncharacterized membrane protein YebE (DUF533 family)